MLKVVWPSRTFAEADIWRVLDLSGMTHSVRQSRNFLRAGYVYLNGFIVLRDTEKVAIGAPFRLELRFPNGYVEGQNIMLIRPVVGNPRSNQPTARHHNGRPR